MKTHYSDYVRHTARFWIKVQPMPQVWNTNVDKMNWSIFDNTIREYDLKSQEILINYYEHGKTEDRYMSLVRRFERDFAKRRGLI